jgi:hypothetical protein
MPIAYRSAEMGGLRWRPVKASSPLRGVDFVGPPEKQPWGGVLAHLRDPDGDILTLPPR